MANEAEIINNPDSTPGAVSTGYQAQNTNLVAQRTGIDKTYVSGGVGTVTVEISGPVDVNGVLYDVKSQTVLTPPSAGRYYITLQGAGPQYLTPTLGTSAGTFDPLKNARYDSSNYRVLNWVIYFDGTDCYVNRLLTPETENNYLPDINEPEETWITSNGNWIAPRSKYYTIYVTGSGGDGVQSTSGDAAGAAGATGIKRIWIDAGDTWTAAFSSSSSGATTFSDGTTTLSAKNGGNGSGNTGGAPNMGSSGFDIVIEGGYGGSGTTSDPLLGGHGGSSFYGGGGRGGHSDGSTNVSGTDGLCWGSGGGGFGIGSATSGKQGIIRIIG